MKTTISANELLELNTCSSALDVFLKAHGEKRVTLSEFLESNGWDDICWFIDASDDFSNAQKRDIQHFICDCAEDVLSIFEDAYPDDFRPRNAIVVARHFADGDATMEELIAARDDAWRVARATGDIARKSWKVARAIKGYALEEWAIARATGSVARAARAAAWATGDIGKDAFGNTLGAVLGATCWEDNGATGWASRGLAINVRVAKIDEYKEKLMSLLIKWEQSC